MKKYLIPTLIIVVFLVGLLIVSIATGIPKNLWETQKQKGDIIQPPKSIEKEDSSTKHIEHTDSMDLDPIKLRNNLDVLIATGKLKIATVLIKHAEDVSIIRRTGVIILTQEANYVVIIGNQERIDAVESLGFVLKEPVESDHKMRRIKVWVDDREQISQIQQIASDIWPVEHIPGYVYGGAFDFEIQILRDKGYDVEFGH